MHFLHFRLLLNDRFLKNVAEEQNIIWQSTEIYNFPLLLKYLRLNT